MPLIFNRIATTPIVLASLMAALGAAPASAQDTVEYEFEFVAEWSAQTHPTNFPSNPHFSPVVGATHERSVGLWSPGALASTGIEQMAETGASTHLRNETFALIFADEADQFLNLGGIGTSPGTRTGSFTASADFPALSLVTMVAPSPDWFVGVHAVDLRAGGVWVQELVFDLDPYDAGTDAGLSYTSPNADQNPPAPIANIAAASPFNGKGRLGTFRVTLISHAACSVADLAEPYATLDLQDIAAFVGAFLGGHISADLNHDGVLDLQDIAAFVTAFSAGCPD